MPPKPRLTPFRVAAIYAACGSAWIIGSGYAIHAFTHSEPWKAPETYEIFKGLGFIYATAGLLHWLTSRMRREIQRYQNEVADFDRRYRELFETVPEPAFLYDIQTFKIIAVNDAACRNYGWTREEFLHMRIHDICSSDDPKHRDEVVAHFTEENYVIGESVHRRRDGLSFPVRITAQNLSHDGQTLRLAVAIDVQETLRAKEDLQRLNESLERRVLERTESLQNAVSELEWFGEAVRHDLQRPLEQLRSMASELARGAGERLTPAEMESALRLVGATARLENLVDELLEYAKADPLSEHRETLSLVLIVSEVLGQLRRERGDNLQVTVVEPLFWTYAHRPTLTRVVNSLLRIGLVVPPGAPVSHVVVSSTRQGDRTLLRIECDAALAERPAAELAAVTTVPQGTQRGSLGEMRIIQRSLSRIGGTITYHNAGTQRGLFTLDLPSSEPA